MSLILAVEPDAAQADALRAIVGTLAGARLTIVSSKDECVRAIATELPDLMLVSALMAPRDEEDLNAHLRTLGGAAHLQTLTTPSLGQVAEPAASPSFFGRWKRAAPQASGCDPTMFAEQIAAYLAWATEIRGEAKKEPGSGFRVPGPGEEPERPQESVACPVDIQDVSKPVALPDTGHRTAETVSVPDSAAIEIERVRAEARDTMEQELERARERAEQTLAEALRRVQHDAAETLAAEVSRAREEAEEFRQRELARLENEATARLDATLAQARQEAESEALREAAVDRARAAAEAEARDTMEQELERARERAEQTLAEALRRVQHDAAETLATEVSRAREEAEEFRQRELARLENEATARLDATLAQARQEAESEALREAAVDRARAAAEAEARETMALELGRAREQAEQAFADALHQVRNDAAETLATEVSRAREQAEEFRQRELARVGQEAAARLEATLAQVREEAERARVAGQSDAMRQAEEIRAEAARDARAAAEEAASVMLQAEIARVRADTEAHLASEVLRLRADAEQRRSAELDAIRAQLVEVRDSAARQVRVVRPNLQIEAPRAPVDARPVRALAIDVADPTWAPPPMLRSNGAARPGPALDEPAASRDYYDLWRDQREKVAPRPAWPLPAGATPVRRSRWALPMAAALALVTAGGLAVDTSSWALGSRLSAMSSRLTSMIAPEPAPAVEPAPVAGTARRPRRPAKVPDPAPSLDAVPTSGTLAAAKSGWLAIFSRIPLEILVDGRRIGTTDEGQLMVPVGRHEVTLANQRFNYRQTETLEVQPAFVTSHTVTLPMGSVRVSAPEGTEIWIEGERVGQMPLGDLPVAIGTRDIMGRHPDFGELHQVVEVRVDEPASVTFGLP